MLFVHHYYIVLLAFISFISFFFNDTATTEIYTLSLHDALPISSSFRPLQIPTRLARACCSSARRSAVAFEQQADRKSTRLNSSHLGISYAVFCLKKKKNWSKSRTNATLLLGKTKYNFHTARPRS